MRTLLVAVLGLAALSLGACQDDPEATPSSFVRPFVQPFVQPVSSPSTPTSEPAPTGDSSSVAPSGGVAPAAGPELHLRVMSVHAPVGWTNDEGQVSRAEVSASSHGRAAAADRARGGDVRQHGRHRRRLHQERSVRRQDPAAPGRQDLGQDQTPAARVSWTEKGSKNRYEAILAFKDGVAASLNMTIRPSLQKKDPEFVESVLASVQWLV